MAYVKNTWVDQAGQVRYTETTDDGYKIFTPNYENVTEIGTPVNAVNMNHIEDGISGVAIRKHNLTETFNLDEIVLGTANGKQNFYCSKTANNTNNALTDSTKWKLARLGAARNFGEIVTSSLPIVDDDTLHLADGSLLSQTDYPELLSYISSIFVAPTIVTYYAWRETTFAPYRNCYTLSATPQVGDNVYFYSNGKMTIGDTVENTGTGQSGSYIQISSESVRFYRNSNYDENITVFSQNYFTSEADWQATYTTYGECGKYVYNSTNNTVRIPLYNSYFTNTVNPQNLGNLTEASLPNIKGVVAASEKLYKSGTSVADYGAFNNYAQNVVSGQSDNTNFDNDLWNFDASRSSSVYKDSATTVNTQSIKQLVYIVVAK